MGGEAPVSLIAVKVDGNGSAPSATGDVVNSAALREQVVELVRRNLRSGDVVAHASPEEFLVLLQGAAQQQGSQVAGRLCAAIRNHAFAGSGGEGRRIGVTASMGVASAPRHGDDMDVLVNAARGACATIGSGGGDGSVVAPAKPGERAGRSFDIGRFIGRTEELTSLRRWLDEAIAGSPRAVAVIGEAGSGRSALLRQLEPEVRLRGGSMVIARAKMGSVRTPYGIWSQVLQALRRLPDAPSRTWHELTNLDAGIPGTAEGRAGSKYRLLEELSEYVRLAARSRPLVLILDEMQWVDDASWDVLDHLLTQLERERILVGVTIRDDPGQSDIAQRRRTLERIDYYHEVRLSRLTRDEVKRWLEAAMNRQEVGRELLAYVYRHTEGNPLVIAQLLRCMVEEQSLWHNGERWEWTPPSELQLPTGIDAVIARRLSHLSPATQDVLGTAAVLGREFEVEMLLASNVGTPENVRRAISEAISTDILQPNYERGGGGQAFSHARIADALVASIPGDRLAGAHERVARALETRPRTAAETAVHFDMAGCAAEAYKYALEAATHAESVYSYDAAGEFLQIAARDSTSPGELAEVRIRLAHLAETLGRYDEAEELCDLAIEWFAGQGDRHRALTLRRMRERARKELGQHARVTLDALRALDEEAEALGSVRERVEILTMLSQTYGRLGESKEAERLAAECVKMAEQVDDDLLLAGALNRLAITVEQEDPRRARQYYERALELFQIVGNVRGQAGCHSNLGIVAHLEGRHDDARKSLTIAISLARAAGMPDLSGMASLNLGVMMQKLGDHERARELYGDALALFAAVKNSELQLYVLYNMANLDRERKDFSSGAELYEATASLAQRIGQVDVEIGAMAGEGICLLEMGKLDSAKVPLAAVEHRMAGLDGWFQGRELVETLRVRVAAAEGRSQEALQLFDAARNLAEHADMSSAAWLTASVADVLHSIDPQLLRSAMERFSQDVGTLGFAELTRKYQDLVGLQARDEAGDSPHG
ncbi:MAG TPA: AAA family ATPase [Gemmatimonadaceae bacterium]|nr:AAA family ATPase [Gemmatimonadaceae bacterium]